MKQALVIWGLLLLANVVFARENPFVRICKVDGGKAKYYADNYEQFLMCKYGSALIFSETLFSHKIGQTTQAVTALLKGAHSNSSDCTPYGAKTLDLKSEFGLKERLCLFKDGTVISHKTLKKGINSSFNNELKQALTSKKLR